MKLLVFVHQPPMWQHVVSLAGSLLDEKVSNVRSRDWKFGSVMMEGKYGDSLCCVTRLVSSYACSTW